MTRRRRTFTVAAVALAALAAWAWFGGGGGRPPARDGDADVRAREGDGPPPPSTPSLRASAAASAPSPPSPPEGPDLASALDALERVATRNGPGVDDAIRALAERVCVDPPPVAEVLARARAWAEAEKTRAAKFAIFALGRCGREDVLRALIAEMDGGLPPSVAAWIPTALAQVRRADGSGVEGRPVTLVERASVQPPLTETFVVDALLAWWKKPPVAGGFTGGEFHNSCLIALGAAAATDDRALRAVQQEVEKGGNQGASALSFLYLSAHADRVALYGESILRRPDAPEELLRPATMLASQAARASSLAAVADRFEAAETSDLSRFEMLSSLTSPLSRSGAPDPALLAQVERLCGAGLRWLVDHPTVEGKPMRDFGPGGPTWIRQTYETWSVGQSFWVGAWYRFGEVSEPVRRAVAEAVALRVARHPPTTAKEARGALGALGRMVEPSWCPEFVDLLRTRRFDRWTLAEVARRVAAQPGATPSGREAALSRVEEAAKALPPEDRAYVEAAVKAAR